MLLYSFSLQQSLPHQRIRGTVKSIWKHCTPLLLYQCEFVHFYQCEDPVWFLDSQLPYCSSCFWFSDAGGILTFLFWSNFSFGQNVTDCNILTCNDGPQSGSKKEHCSYMVHILDNLSRMTPNDTQLLLSASWGNWIIWHFLIASQQNDSYSF